jgi:hypothetical protein
VSIDGQSHGELLMIAILSGSTVAIVIILILIFTVRPKTNSSDNDELKVMKIVHFGEFMMTPKSQCETEIPSCPKSNLMYKFFGQSLSSLDVNKQPITQYERFFVNSRVFYQQNILATISDSSGCFESQKIIDLMEN